MLTEKTEGELPQSKEARRKARLSEGYEYRKTTLQMGFWTLMGYVGLVAVSGILLGFALGAWLA